MHFGQKEQAEFVKAITEKSFDNIHEIDNFVWEYAERFAKINLQVPRVLYEQYAGAYYFLLNLIPQKVYQGIWS